MAASIAGGMCHCCPSHGTQTAWPVWPPCQALLCRVAGPGAPPRPSDPGRRKEDVQPCRAPTGRWEALPGNGQHTGMWKHQWAAIPAGYGLHTPNPSQKCVRMFDACCSFSKNAAASFCTPRGGWWCALLPCFCNPCHSNSLNVCALRGSLLAVCKLWAFCGCTMDSCRTGVPFRVLWVCTACWWDNAFT